MFEGKTEYHKPLPPPTQAEMLVIKAQRLLAEYSVPGSGITKDQLINDLFRLFDGGIGIEVFTEVMEKRYRIRARRRRLRG